MKPKTVINKTEDLIALISKQRGRTIFNKSVKSKTERWVADHYSDLFYIFKKSSPEQKALNYLKEAYKKERLLKQLCLKNLKIILYTLKDQKLLQKRKKRKLTNGVFIDKIRFTELKKIKSNVYDLSRLIRMCEEVNDAFSRENYISTVALVRSIIDHVPPIFACKNFQEIANNYKGAKSFKESMLHLDNSSRKIADSHLHIQIRKKEILPTKTQVNFSNDLDVLLGEVVRILCKDSTNKN